MGRRPLLTTVLGSDGLWLEGAFGTCQLWREVPVHLVSWCHLGPRAGVSDGVLWLAGVPRLPAVALLLLRVFLLS